MSRRRAALISRALRDDDPRTHRRFFVSILLSAYSANFLFSNPNNPTTGLKVNESHQKATEAIEKSSQGPGNSVGPLPFSFSICSSPTREERGRSRGRKQGSSGKKNPPKKQPIDHKSGRGVATRCRDSKELPSATIATARKKKKKKKKAPRKEGTQEVVSGRSRLDMTSVNAV